MASSYKKAIQKKENDMISTVKVIICDVCGDVRKIYEDQRGDDIIPAEWKASKNRHDVHFCPMCAKALNDAIKAPNGLKWRG